MKNIKPNHTQCLSAKIRHESEEEALRAARGGIYRGPPPLYVYSCILCFGWHLTSKDYRKKIY